MSFGEESCGVNIDDLALKQTVTSRSLWEIQSVFLWRIDENIQRSLTIGFRIESE